MYAEKEILTDVKEINNILMDNEYTELKNHLSRLHISNENIFDDSNQYSINLAIDNPIIKQLFDRIKKKFNYNGTVNTGYCKIQSYSDNENYHVLSNKKTTTIFSFNINDNQKPIFGEIVQITNLKQRGKFNKCKLSLLKDEWNNNQMITDYTNDNTYQNFNTEKQNAYDQQGYLYMLSPENDNTGYAYEHIDNSCIQFPGYYIHKMKPYYRYVNKKRISIILICENI